MFDIFYRTLGASAQPKNPPHDCIGTKTGVVARIGHAMFDGEVRLYILFSDETEIRRLRFRFPSDSLLELWSTTQAGDDLEIDFSSDDAWPIRRIVNRTAKLSLERAELTYWDYQRS